MNLTESIAEILCPYLNNEKDVCVASCSGLKIDEWMRMKYCLREGYDNCIVFKVTNLIKKNKK